MDVCVGGGGRGGASSSKQQKVLHVAAFVDTAISPVNAREHLTQTARCQRSRLRFLLHLRQLSVLVIFLDLLFIFAGFKGPGLPAAVRLVITRELEVSGQLEKLQQIRLG